MKFLRSIVMTCAILIYAPLSMAAADKPAVQPQEKQYDKKIAVSDAPASGEITPLAGGKTIAEIYTESDQLKGQVVSLRAKVTKVNMNIMGKNWITLRDGTGTRSEVKIVATSSESAALGAVVIAKGKINTDVEIGRGYSYKVMMEEATFSPDED